jgi:hypothetical protein
MGYTVLEPSILIFPDRVVLSFAPPDFCFPLHAARIRRSRGRIINLAFIRI